MWERTLLRSVAAAVLVSMLVGSCAGASGPPPRVIEVRMADFSFAPSDLVLKGGERVTLKFANEGSLQHEFMAGRQPDPEAGYAEDLLDGVQVEQQGGIAGGHGGAHAGTMLRVAAGRTAQMTFTVPERTGAFEFGCFEPGHYLLGMRGSLVIQ